MAFPLAWTVIEAALAVGGDRVSRAREEESIGFVGLECCDNWQLEPTLFQAHRLGVSTVAAAGLVAMGAAFVHQARQIDNTSQCKQGGMHSAALQ